MDGVDDLAAGIIWMAGSCNIDARLSSQVNATSLVVGSRTRDGCVDIVILLNVRQDLLTHTILDPPKSFIGIGKSIDEADVKVKMPVILDDANG